METNEILKDYKFSSLSEKSKQKVFLKFKTLDEVSAKDFYIDILEAVKVSLDKIQLLKHLSWLLNEIIEYKGKENFRNYLESAVSHFHNFNIVILACKGKATDALRYIFLDKNKTLYSFSCQFHNKVISPKDLDEFHHDAFYYALRSNETVILRTLIDKWPNKLFNENLEELDQLLSKNYKELKLRNVFLTKEMELFVQTELLKIRFFHKKSEDINTGNSIIHIRKRIDLVIENIKLIKNTYLESDPDEEFILVAEFIAKNIHILKSVLKSTYDKLPWEEIEFCLTIFIRLCKKLFEANIVYNTVLEKNQLLLYLEKFSNILESEKKNIESSDIKTLGKSIDMKRHKVVKNIIKINSIFKNLYADYETMRDFCSLETIQHYTSLAVSTAVSTREGKLIILRGLQVTGEHTINEVDNPKLSHNTAQLLMFLLSSDTKEVIKKLRNSLSHNNYPTVQSELENKSHSFFKDIQTDIAKISSRVTDILSEIKRRQMKVLLLRLKHCKFWRDVRDLLETYSFSFESIVVEMEKLNFNTWIKRDSWYLWELLTNLYALCGNKTPFEDDLFQQVKVIIQTEKDEIMNTKKEIASTFYKINNIYRFSKNVNINDVFNIDLLPYDLEMSYVSTAPSINLIKELVKKLLISIAPRVSSENVEISNIIWEIFHLIEFQMDNIKWIKELASIFCLKKQKNAFYKEIENKQDLPLKISQLRKILKENNLIDNFLLSNLSFFEKNKELQVVIEMLVLDILSYVEKSCIFNIFFLDNDYIFQTGKNLRNNLAHLNILIQDLAPMASIQLLLNAHKIASENLTNKSGIIGQIEKCDPFQLEATHRKNLSIIHNQKALFNALKEGNMEKVQKCVSEGADIFGKDLNSLSCSHFSAKAPNFESIKYCLKQGLSINSKDSKAQTELHFAVQYNRFEIVDYLLRKGASINICDLQGQTPLHVAAENGRNEIVNYLLEHKAGISKNTFGFTPLHCAIFKSKTETAKIFLEKETKVDTIKSKCGFTPLYTAAETGDRNLVKLLIAKKANINSKDDFGNTPLHIASYLGRQDAVEILIMNGADINAKNIEGDTALHCAAKNGNESIVHLLLENKADVRSTNKFNLVPMHRAAANGHLNIAELFIRADNYLVNATGSFGLTPMNIAAQFGHGKLVKLLLERKAKIDSKMSNDNTALHLGTYYGFFDVVKTLVENGADVTVKENLTGCTPLHLATLQGHLQISELLICNGADIYSENASGSSCFDIAVSQGHKDIVKLFLKTGSNFRKIRLSSKNVTIFTALNELLLKENFSMNLEVEDFVFLLPQAASFGQQSMIEFCLDKGCNVNTRDKSGLTALCLAAQNNYQEIVTLLLEKGADASAKDNAGNTALCFAAKSNAKEIVRILINKQVETTQLVIDDRYKSLSLAVFAGHYSIVELLFHECKFDIDVLKQKFDLLHKASQYGYRKVVEFLLGKGFEIDGPNDNNYTPLHYAVIYKRCEIVRLLISKGANVNAQDGEGKTVLHRIAETGSVELLEISLIEEANISIRDKENRSVIEVAVSYDQLEIVKILLRKKRIDINLKGNKGFTLLHISAEIGSLKITDYICRRGAFIDAKEINGSKPIHIAAKKGHVNIVEYYLDKNVPINDLGHKNFTPLHFAASDGKIGVCKFLIEREADIDSLTESRETPAQLAATKGHLDVFCILLHHGAYCNVSSMSVKPVTESRPVDGLLKLLSTLTIAVENNDPEGVELQLREGDRLHPNFIISNARCVRNETPILYAAREGYEEIIDILLKFKANPNICGKNKLTPLHYAAKFSHLKIVKALLMNGAEYNALCCSRKSPLNHATDQTIISLLSFVHKVFAKIKNRNKSVFKDLTNRRREEFSNLVMRIKDRGGKNLIVFAILSGFPKIEHLKELFQEDVMHSWKYASDFICQRKYGEAVRELKIVLDRRIEIFGLENPATLDVMKKLAKIHLKLHEYDEALNLLNEIYKHITKLFYENHRETLAIEYLVALTLRKQGQNLQAFGRFKSVLKHEKLFSVHNKEILFSKIEMALIFAEMGSFDKAVKKSNDVFKQSYKKNGSMHETTLYCSYSVAKILSMMGNYSDAIEIFECVYETQKNLLGSYHVNTLQTQSSIAEMLYKLKKYDESNKMFKKILKIQKSNFLENCVQILSNKIYIGNILLAQGMTIAALKIFLALKPKISKFEPNHFLAKAIEASMKSVLFRLKLTDSEWIIDEIQNEIKKDGTKKDSEKAEITDVEETLNNDLY